MCSTCGIHQPFTRCRLTNKTKGLWKCNFCNTKTVCLSRKLGGWPNAAFQSLTEEERQAFMASLHGKTTEEALVAFEELMEKVEEHWTEYEDSGEFLPAVGGVEGEGV